MEQEPLPIANRFDFLTEEIVFTILDCLNDDAFAKKSFSLVCKSFYFIESCHRKSLRPLNSDFISRTLKRYRFISELDLSLCPRVDDAALFQIASSRSFLRSINLSRSRMFTHNGVSSLVANCTNLVEIDLSNRTELTDSAAKAIAEAKNLERLWLARCKMITDMGIGCVAVGCRKLRFICLKWCLRVSDLGVGLIAMKCKQIRTLDLSYLPVSFCLVAKKVDFVIVGWYVWFVSFLGCLLFCFNDFVRALFFFFLFLWFGLRLGNYVFVDWSIWQIRWCHNVFFS